MALFSSGDWASIERAVQQEIEETRKGAQTLWLDIDAIEHVQQASGRYIYRLLLSQPTRLETDQTITFTSRGKDKIRTVVIACSDNELVVDCEAPLPDDARLQQVELDASFIYRALLDFLREKDAEPVPLAASLVERHLLAPGTRKPVPPKIDGLNDDQQRAVAEMKADAIHLLWGPPGTGKTTTVGAAVARWLREGKSVLLVSTSNAAVDVAVKSLLKRITPQERSRVLRLGTSTDKEIAALTLGGKYSQRNARLSSEVAKVEDRLRHISEIVATKLNHPDELAKLFEERRRLEPVVARFNEQVVAATDNLAADVKVFAATLAKMVLDKTIKTKQFDVVVVDEVSMVSILYAVAAATLSGAHVVYAGDPKQLPPVVQSDYDDAQKWFGPNVFDWLGIDESSLGKNLPMTFLRTQYRMTNQIGKIVSRLSYGDGLAHGRNADGVKAMFVDMPPQWQTKIYSVRERSYYHPATVPILHTLIGSLGGGQKEMLLLTPFRAQQSLLSAVAFDLKTQHPQWDIRASTIHRSQGSERHTVIVDLTTHSPEDLSSFFEDGTGDLLVNVAISRAASRLIVLGCRDMFHAVAGRRPFWKRVLMEFENECDIYPADEVLEDAEVHSKLGEVVVAHPSQDKGLPVICCCRGDRPTGEEVEAVRTAVASRKLLVSKDTAGVDGNFIIRSPSASCPTLFVAHGTLSVPYKGKWLTAGSPAASKVLWRIGFSHLAEEEVNPNEARRFFCPKCVPGNLLLKRTGEGWKLVCSEFPHHCSYSRHLSLEDAKAKVRLQGMTCPSGHPLTARTSTKGIFLGCENYPRCDYSSNLSVLVGT